MTAITSFDLDQTGKIDLSGIYDRPDPRDYYQTLARLDYRIPGTAMPLLRRTANALRARRGERRLTVLDVGCSYGVNAALLKHAYDLGELFALYGTDNAAGLSRSTLLARDRSLFRDQTSDQDIAVVGLDIAAEAVTYARQAGILDEAIAADLEAGPVPDDAPLAPVDLVISTGAIGYVGAPTFTRILEAADGQPWFALFALRMFPFDEIADALRGHGYAIYRLAGRTFRQRRFASHEEAAQVLERLAALGLDPIGREATGWFHAEFFLALPRDSGPLPFAGLVPFGRD